MEEPCTVDTQMSYEAGGLGLCRSELTLLSGTLEPCRAVCSTLAVSSATIAGLCVVRSCQHREEHCQVGGCKRPGGDFTHHCWCRSAKSPFKWLYLQWLLLQSECSICCCASTLWVVRKLLSDAVEPESRSSWRKGLSPSAGCLCLPLPTKGTRG